MPRQTPLPEKGRWLILVTGLTVSIPLYAVVVFVLASAQVLAAPAPAGLRFAIYGCAFALVFLSLVVAPRVGEDRATALPFDAFLRRTIFSLALAETSAILGLVLYFLGRNLGDFLVLAGLALELDDEMPEARLLLGRIRRALGDAAAALQELDEAIEQSPEMDELYVERARLLRSAGHPFLAWRDAQWALDYNDASVDAYIERGQLALELQTASEALDDLDRAVELDPESALAHAWRGRAHQLAGDPRSAERDWAAAEDLLEPSDELRATIRAWRGGRA